MSACDGNEVTKGRKSLEVKGVLCLAVATVSASIGSGASIGYGISSLNNPRLVVISDLQPGSMCRDNFKESEVLPDSNTLFELATSSLSLGVLLGAIFAGNLADRLGRRRTLLLVNLLAVPLVVMVLLTNSFAMLIAGRVLHGIMAGIAMITASAYLSEISPVSHRGILGLVNIIFIVSMMFIAPVLGLPQIWGTCSKWRFLVAFPGVFSLVQIIGMTFSPPSPRYLYIYQHNKLAARKALQKLRGTQAVQDDLDEMKSEKRQVMKMKQVSIVGLFRDQTLRWQMVIVVMLNLGQQLSGIDGIFFYGRTIFESAGIKQAAAAALFPSLLQIVVVVLASFFVERFGRRALILYGFGLMVFFYLILSAGFCFKEAAGKWSGVIVLVGALGVVGAYNIGPGSLVWIVTTELFPQDSRATAASVAGITNYLANYAVGQTYLILLRHSQPYGMIVFVFINTFFWLFFFVYLPETGGKSTEEIQTYFKERSKKG